MIFYFEYPLKTWGNPFFAAYRSLHKPKPKDFLQLILLIFYFEYPLITWGNPLFAIYFLLCALSSRSYFTSGGSTNCLRDHLSNHQIWYFKSKSPYAIGLFFFHQKNVISRVFSQAHKITWPFFHKKHQIKKFGFMNSRRVLFFFIRILFYFNYCKGL